MTSRQWPAIVGGETGLAEYLDKINRFPFLTQEEEYDHAVRWVREGDIESAHALLKSHLRLVAKTAFGLTGYGLPVADLISEGNIGLMQAIKRFDPDKGFRLSTYALWWIKASMQEYILRSWSLVKIGTTAAQKKLFFNLRRLKSALEKTDNSALSADDAARIAAELDVTENEVREMDMRLSLFDRSIDERAHVGGDESDARTLGETLSSGEPDYGDALAERESGKMRRNLLKKAMALLSSREKDILSRRRLREKGATLEELSAEYGVSRERVRQIEAKAINKIRAYFAHTSKEGGA
ncbi:MAG: RNA polymerase sigma factor RpoH [Rickettsiales bacterium]